MADSKSRCNRWLGVALIAPLSVLTVGLLAGLVSSVYLGWYRHELDYVNLGPDPAAFDHGPPSASGSGVMLLVLAWLLIGFLPLVLRQVLRWSRTRKTPTRRRDAP